MMLTRAIRYSVVAALVLAVSAVEAASIAPSIAINFGADEPAGARSDVSGAAGVFGTVNWNNLDGGTGGPADLMVDDDGTAAASDVKVSWVSNGTWSSTGRGEENNTAPDGDDRALMSGYLDTNNTSVTEVNITGLDTSFTDPGYSVVVYMKGGVNGRGGQYTITSPSHISTLENEQMQAFDGEFVPGESFFVFTGLTDSNFQLSGTPTIGAVPRAPINGIEIVAVVPEPSAVMLFGLGVVGLFELFRRVRRQG